MGVQPLLPTSDVTRSVDFYGALGFAVIRDETIPYRFAEVTDDDLWLLLTSLAQYGGKKAFGAFMVTVKDVPRLHKRFADGLRSALGRVPTAGLPRMTRLARDKGQFRVFDPSGNMLVYLDADYDPPPYAERADAVEAALTDAMFNRDIYANDAVAAHVLDRALAQLTASDDLGRARLLAARAEIAIAKGEREVAARMEAEIATMELSRADRERFADELSAPQVLRRWIGG